MTISKFLNLFLLNSNKSSNIYTTCLAKSLIESKENLPFKEIYKLVYMSLR